MCVQERRAWFLLIVVMAAFALYGIFTAVPKLHSGAMAAYAVLALIAAEPLVGRKAISEGTVVFDERDREIHVAAMGASFGVVWVLFVAAAMIPFYLLGPSGKLTLSTITLSNIVFPAMGVVYLVRSLVMIMLYRKQAHAG